jgi:hypothetical protein
MENSDVSLPPPWRREVRSKEVARVIGCNVAMFHASTKDVQLQNCALVRRAYQRRIKLISVDSINKFLTPLTASASEQQPVTKEAP